MEIKGCFKNERREKTRENKISCQFDFRPKWQEGQADAGHNKTDAVRDSQPPRQHGDNRRHEQQKLNAFDT